MKQETQNRLVALQKELLNIVEHESMPESYSKRLVNSARLIYDVTYLNDCGVKEFGEG